MKILATLLLLSSAALAEETVQTAFKRGVLRNCALPRMVCNCVAETMADQLTYEEVMQTIRSNGAYSASTIEKRNRAMVACEKMAAVR